LVDLCGMDTLDQLPGRWVFYDRDFTELFGDWRKWRGMIVSNLYFTSGLIKSPPRWQQPYFNFLSDCDHSDF
jgi:hypothetical protein